ncbi:MAG: NAD(P)H-binding protein [Bacteroidota bacterium]
MKNVLITGATGMIGGIVLRECLAHSEVGSVTIIVRRSTGQHHPKLTEILHDDFTDYSKIADHFKNVDVAQFCIGVYTGQVPRDQFRVITVDFTAAFADMLKQHSPQATFCFLSGQGADQTESSRLMFAKDKGIAENALLRQAFGATYIFRPAYIYPVTPRKEPSFTYRLMRSLYPLLKAIYPQGAISSERLAKAMFKAGLYGADKTILENEDIKAV